MRVQTIYSQGPAVVGLCGLAGSGKSTAAGLLAENQYKVFSFADPFKGMLSELLGCLDLDPAEVSDRLSGGAKEVPIVELPGAPSARRLMQTLGTDWARLCLDPDFWVHVARRRVRADLAAGRRIVFDDVRFPNEADMIREIGGEVWQLTGRSAALSEGGLGHASERLEFAADRVLENDGSFDHLETQVLEALLG